MALGTDGVCSNNSADLFETMKTTALVQKMLNNDPCLLPARQVLEMATQAGLASQGRAGEAGMLRCVYEEVERIGDDRPPILLTLFHFLPLWARKNRRQQGKALA